MNIQQFINALGPINDIKKVKELFTFLIKDRELGAGFSPDTEFSDYINEEGLPAFRPVHAAQLQMLMEESFMLCRDKDVDIYEIALDITSENEALHEVARKDAGAVAWSGPDQEAGKAL